MNSQNFQHRHLISAFLCVGMLLGSSTLALAESSPHDQIKAMTKADKSKTSYTDRGQPGVQTGQASRGSCTSGINSQDLLAYIPQETAEGHPHFQFEIPFASTTFHSVEFILVADNAEREMIYETQLAANQLSPEVQINLPSNLSELEVNQSYNWKLIVHCSDPTNVVNMQDAIYVEGSIKRVQLNAGTER
ncbi:DUF928 domain-containing protein [Lyngbya sp. PCC 8106]|uniref:DUF928 domain-containing protein n=1 Tax=Lyngbya sp. (strain PCC 8106) TaxID=313612 RepID=UPI0000EA8CBD|nr:DUF928 domain-containing protein [Lyngbya sp. PCC 8106]EAW36319.1 hypothetical protein L8106_23356 [Lyngbya sp. PCC 8106]